MMVDEDQKAYIGVGFTSPEIANRLGWDQENIWMPEHALQWIQANHATLSDPIGAAHIILNHPRSVHQDLQSDDGIYFITDAEELRSGGLLKSRSTRYVDAVVRFEWVSDGAFLRPFHLSPRKRNQGGFQLWP
ncbi:hypothetical protein [Nitrolancea hollandica]|uniref:hypothetical protein n=1 Tax=Nitrolancea hollandica TaxID=1206749 RepID=UPI001EE64CD2|nr:hypothetical protein [Nitrolancea hollandica]